MDLFELKKEQLKLARKISLKDDFSTIKTIGGAVCVQLGNKLLAMIVVCGLPSFKIIEKKSYVLNNPLSYKPGFLAYREMPAIIEAYNQLEEEPDLLFVMGAGVLHPRKIGIASHLGLALNKATIGIQEKLIIGNAEKGKIFLDDEMLGFEMKTKEHSNPIFASPGYLVSMGTVLNIIPKTIIHPHKIPEPLYLARKIAKKLVKTKNKEA
ncbi:MAG: endonuclease V [Nanoarchaeota archaeon]|nr:endonuclease V [Nanoarchaeota archaeon]MBU1631831.1 endonuclease V [Nanoarchaeota archaeon]MBU1876104.1 endonuclease V [Nanoarchaeota archaeon]